ncbi:hypothetical protein POM88_042219 [Heracleum sosnowskyi]|uniref:F-box domain-containing protein n=1 Tax=Heracleum sosnowskyi TaxID=360622 RepID=A0AAD8HI15_9APIA|nr:hypothetical protein POM88_042219 [Heracleum sosnowskyi]
MGDTFGINSLSQELIEEILSRTSPHVCGQLSTVCKNIRSAANSDHVWEKFLPLDIISRRTLSDQCLFDDPWKKIDSDTLHAFPTKKDLYLFLCDNPLFIDGGDMYIWLEKLSGNKCFRIGPLKLIKRHPDDWRVLSVEAGYRRFPNLPVLHNAMNFEIEGKISTSLLSPNAKYTAYLLLDFSSEWYSFGSGVQQPLKAWVGIDGHGGKRNVYIPYKLFIPELTGPHWYPVWRHDGLNEVVLGDYLNKELGTDSSELWMCLREVKSNMRKSGIKLHGMEIRVSRPKSCIKSEESKIRSYWMMNAQVKNMHSYSDLFTEALAKVFGTLKPEGMEFPFI